MLAGNILELLLFSVPSLLYRAQLRRRGRSRAAASAAVGLRPGRARDYGLALVVLAITAGLGYAALRLIPAGQLSRHGVTVGAAHTATGYLGIALLALAEEMLFRGFIAGMLIRRYGFRAGNLAQAGIFLAPHCLLLLASARLWPILPVQFVAGWLLGWLRT